MSQRLKDHENRCADAVSKVYAIDAFNNLIHTLNIVRIRSLTETKNKGLAFVREALSVLDKRVLDKLKEECFDFSNTISDFIFDLYLQKLANLFVDPRNQNLESTGYAIEADERSNEFKEEISIECFGKCVDLVSKLEKILSYKEALLSNFNRYKDALDDEPKYDYGHLLTVFSHSVRGDLVSAGLEILDKTLEAFKEASTDVDFIKKYEGVFVEYLGEIDQLQSEMVVTSGRLRSYIKTTMISLNVKKMLMIIKDIETEGGSVDAYVSVTLSDRSLEKLENDSRFKLATELKL